MTEAQQVAMIRTMLSFIGKQTYSPSSSAVLAQLREMTAGAGLISGSKATVGGGPLQGAGTTASWNRVNNVSGQPGTGVTTKI